MSVGIAFSSNIQAVNAPQIESVHDQGVKNAWVELSKLDKFADELPYKYGKQEAMVRTSHVAVADHQILIEDALEQAVTNIGRHIDLDLEYHSKQFLLRFRNSLEKLNLSLFIVSLVIAY